METQKNSYKSYKSILLALFLIGTVPYIISGFMAKIMSPFYSNTSESLMINFTTGFVIYIFPLTLMLSGLYIFQSKNNDTFALKEELKDIHILYFILGFFISSFLVSLFVLIQIKGRNLNLIISPDTKDSLFLFNFIFNIALKLFKSFVVTLIFYYFFITRSDQKHILLTILIASLSLSSGGFKSFLFLNNFILSLIGALWVYKKKNIYFSVGILSGFEIVKTHIFGIHQTLRMTINNVRPLSTSIFLNANNNNGLIDKSELSVEESFILLIFLIVFLAITLYFNRNLLKNLKK